MAASLGQLAEQLPVLEREQVGQPDVVHRMSQILSLHELADRLVIGERFVLTHQDMIWDRTRAYHVGDALRDYRRATAATLALADHGVPSISTQRGTLPATVASSSIARRSSRSASTISPSGRFPRLPRGRWTTRPTS